MASGEAGVVPALRAALDVSAFHAARGERVRSRTIREEPETIWRAISALLGRCASREYLGFDDPTFLDTGAVTERIRVRGFRTMDALVDRGVEVRQVTTASGVRRDAPEAPSLMWRSGGQARTVEQLPLKACVVDRRFALVPTDLTVLAHGVTVVTDPTVIALLVALHERLWRIGADPAATLDAPPAHLVPVLESLAGGLPDERAAVRAGITARTYSRRVAELTALLGARSRFEAGVLAARRGWL